MNNEVIKVTAKYSRDGRITIPKEFRISLGLDNVCEFELSIQGHNIVLEPVRDRCFICGKSISPNDYNKVSDLVLCNKCNNELLIHYSNLRRKK